MMGFKIVYLMNCKNFIIIEEETARNLMGSLTLANIDAIADAKLASLWRLCQVMKTEKSSIRSRAVFLIVMILPRDESCAIKHMSIKL